MSLVERIRGLCKEQGITIAELERTVGIGNGVVRRWDDRAPASDKVIAVAEYFGVSTDYLHGLTNARQAGEVAAASSDIDYKDWTPEMLEELERAKEFIRFKFGKK